MKGLNWERRYENEWVEMRMWTLPVTHSCWTETEKPQAGTIFQHREHVRVDELVSIWRKVVQVELSNWSCCV